MQINHFWIKTCSFKFSVFANQEEAASRCSCRIFAAQENHVMICNGQAQAQP